MATLTTLALPEARVTGVCADDVTCFLGLRYADPPTGAYRFAPPREISGPRGDVEATAFAPAAPQSPRSHSQLLHGPVPPMDEDCLALNVWVPNGRNGPAPVLVWIHGGAFLSGHTSAPCYEARRLASLGKIVVITVGYRLGSLGWLSHQDLSRGQDGTAGNWGLLDVMAALRWIRRNVAGFGGDPDRVTLAGQSAGALCALLLLSAPAMSRDFHCVIAQSPVLAAASSDDAARWAAALTEHADCAGIARLRELPASRIVDADLMLSGKAAFQGLTRGPFPAAGTATVPWPPGDERAIQAGSGIPVLIGHTDDEGLFFYRDSALSDDALARRIGRLTPQRDIASTVHLHREILRRRHAPSGNDAVYSSVWSEERFGRPIRQWVAGRRTHGGAPTYAYRLAHRSPVLGGAAHVIDVPLVFGTHRHPSLHGLCGTGPRVDQLSDQMIAAWAAFAASACPHTAGLGAWPEDATVVLDSAGPWRAAPEPAAPSAGS
jgi:para-nitrobenzyl esterase